MTDKLNQIKHMADNACKFVRDGKWYQMNWCDEEGYFCCEDLETGEQFEIDYDNVDLENGDAFYELTLMTLT